MNQPNPNPESSDAEQTPPNGVSQATNASPAEVARFVTSIKDAERQVGEHVIQALQHNDTVAVLTTVVIGPGGGQHIVSAALNPSQMAEVNRLLQSATVEREEEEMCVGFHCLIKPKGPKQE